MGYAKYFEDDEDRRTEAFQNYQFRKATTWDEERGRIDIFLNKVPDEVTSAGMMLEKTQKESLLKLQAALRYRINLSRTLDELSTALSQTLVHGYRKNLVEAYNRTTKLVNQLPEQRCQEQVELTDCEKHMEKNNMVFQLSNMIIAAINNFPAFEAEDISQPLYDLRCLIAWHRKNKTILGSLQNLEMQDTGVSSFFSEELENDMVTCGKCYGRTTANCKCCVLCGTPL